MSCGSRPSPAPYAARATEHGQPAATRRQSLSPALGWTRRCGNMSVRNRRRAEARRETKAAPSGPSEQCVSDPNVIVCEVRTACETAQEATRDASHAFRRFFRSSRLSVDTAVTRGRVGHTHPKRGLSRACGSRGGCRACGLAAAPRDRPDHRQAHPTGATAPVRTNQSISQTLDSIPRSASERNG